MPTPDLQAHTLWQQQEVQTDLPGRVGVCD